MKPKNEPRLRSVVPKSCLAATKWLFLLHRNEMHTLYCMLGVKFAQYRVNVNKKITDDENDRLDIGGIYVPANYWAIISAFRINSIPIKKPDNALRGAKQLNLRVLSIIAPGW